MARAAWWRGTPAAAPVAEPEPVADAEPEPDAELEQVAEPDAELEQVAEPEQMAEPEARPDAESDDAEPDTQPEPDTGEIPRPREWSSRPPATLPAPAPPAADPAPGADPAVDPVAVAETVADPDAVPVVAPVRRRGRLARISLVTLLVAGALTATALLVWPGIGARSGIAATDPRAAAVSAWREGNAAWARGDIAAVCDRYDGVGQGGMWATRAICLESEQQGYDSATAERKRALREMDVDPRSVQLLDGDTMVIWFRDVRVDGSRPEYFTSDDLAVMRRLNGQWRQVGARYRGVVVGQLPLALTRTPGSPSASPSR